MADAKEHILRTSLLLFMQNSYKDVTLNSIVAQTGLSKGAFYHYFASKEEVFKAVVRYFYESQMFINFTEMPNDTLKAFYAAYIDNFHRLHEEYKEIYQTLNVSGFIMTASLKLPDFIEIQERSNRRELAYWQQAVTNGRKRAEINADLPDEIIATLFVSICKGILLNKGSCSYKNHDEFIAALTTHLTALYRLVQAAPC